jgi:drug/metabolite transporter (DMT)-like permease
MRRDTHVTTLPWLWAVFTVIAAAAQTVRNAMQRELTSGLGTVGATHVRFLFGFPFAVCFLVILLLVSGVPLPRPGLNFWPWVVDGAATQIAATALMLVAMGERSFVVTIAYLKTEPIQVAIFGLIFLGDAVTVPMMIAILVATAGVMVMAMPQSALPRWWGKTDGGTSDGKSAGKIGGLRPTLIGLASGGMFAASAIGFRGAILELHLPNYTMAATFTLVIGLAMQAATLSCYLWLRQPSVMFALMRAWKPSVFAGFMGALASQFWFLAFALATAASVRTLALVEVLFAQLVARFAFGQRTSLREAIGMVLIIAGVVLLILAY